MYTQHSSEVLTPCWHNKTRRRHYRPTANSSAS